MINFDHRIYCQIGSACAEGMFARGSIIRYLCYAVPPTRSGFPDFGPDPDFFDQTGPDLVRNLVRSPDFSKNCQTNA